MKPYRHTNRAQNSTVNGSITLIGAIMLIFSGVEIKDTVSVLSNLEYDKIMPLLIIIYGGVKSIITKEKTKESIVNEIKDKKRGT